MAYIEFKNVTKEYENESTEVKALKKVDFEIEKGELVVITGPSCSGKTTILNILAGIDSISQGSVIVKKTDIALLKERKLVKYRRENVSLIPNGNLLDENLSVKENVLLSKEVNNNKTDVNKIIKKFGLTKKENDFPSQLSDSERKKTIIASAIAKNPSIILGDEPFNYLDDKDTKQVIKILQSMIKKEKITIIIASNSDEIKGLANKVITLKNGKVLEVKTNKK